MCRVSSGVSVRAPTGARRPLTSTRGGLPGEKNKSLIFAELRNIAVSNAGIENGAGADAGAAAAAVATVVEPAALSRAAFVGASFPGSIMIKVSLEY
jgi:hypothetical protein